MENVVAAMTGVTPVPITCLTFENGMQGSNDVSLTVTDAVIKTSTLYGLLASFNGNTAKIKVPSLANTYRYDVCVMVYHCDFIYLIAMPGLERIILQRHSI